MNLLQGKRVLLAGGCGFLGSYLVPVLLREGAVVTVVDNLESGDRSVLAPFGRDVSFVQADVRDRHSCDALLDRTDVLINLAAKASGVGFSRTHHAEMLIDNVLCGLVPLQAAVRHGVSHIVLTSTSCVYPDDVETPTPELDPFCGAPEEVNQGYGWAKRVHELAGGYVSRETNACVTIVRPFNMYGANYPWRSTEKAHVIPALVKRVLDGEDPVVVWGSGEQRRNFLHGSDAAELIVRVVARAPGHTVNLGYEEDTSIADLIALICEVTGRHPKIVFDRSKPDGARRKSADATRLRSLTDNYQPRVSLRDGIEEMARWYERSWATNLDR